MSRVLFGVCPKCGETGEPRIEFCSSVPVPHPRFQMSYLPQCNVLQREHFHLECLRCTVGWAADMNGKPI